MKHEKPHLRFDVALNQQLGIGFYLTANLNEAKYYACRRLIERQKTTKNNSLQGIILVFGIDDHAQIKGNCHLNTLPFHP